MSRSKWRATTLNEYVDGQLSAPRRRALEETLSHDDELREEVATLRQTVQMLRAIPLREPPRNYRLSPQMVSSPKRTVWNWPTPNLRWASTAAALLLIIGLSWLWLNGPKYAAMPLPEAAPMAQPATEAQQLRTERTQATAETAPALSKSAGTQADYQADTTAAEPLSADAANDITPRPTASTSTPEPTRLQETPRSSRNSWIMRLSLAALLLIAVRYWWAKK